jgi:uncharacterized protein (TIGR03437 family)
MLYLSNDQLGVIAPYALAGAAKATIAVYVNGASSVPVELDVVAARPGLFTADSSGRGQAAILNQDGSYNSAANPAAAGSIVAMFGTGEGQTAPAGVDGRLATGNTLPRPRLPLGVLICGEAAEVVYAGAAPGVTAGLLQVNAKVPTACEGKGEVMVELRVGTAGSPEDVTMVVR